MIITKSWLKRKRACTPGYQWFIKTFPNGFDPNRDYWPGDIRSFQGTKQKEWLCDTLVVLLNNTSYSMVPRSQFPRTLLAQELSNYLIFKNYDWARWGSLHDRLMRLGARELNKALKEVMAAKDRK